MGTEKTATVNAAELKGIAMATEAILHHKPTTATIFLDSQAAIKALIHPAQTSDQLYLIYPNHTMARCIPAEKPHSVEVSLNLVTRGDLQDMIPMLITITHQIQVSRCKCVLRTRSRCPLPTIIILASGVSRVV
jgi:hypothetical protein